MLPSITSPSLSALLVLLLLPWHTVASVLAIDYGADFTKVSLMKPGVPFDVVLNRDSKRKIASSVAWKGDERLFGADAVAIAARFPSTSYSSLKYLQGATYSSAPSQFHHLLYPALDVSEAPERSTHQFKRKEGEVWTNEELVAMQFAYAKELAEGVAGERVKDAVVTVPAYYNHFERQAVIDSLHLAGLKDLALVNDGTAIAVNFAMSRTFPTLEHHIIYDAGASGTRATLVSFQTVTEPVSPKSKKTKDVIHVTVKGFGYDKQASGSEMDLRLRELLREKFEDKHFRGKSIEKEHRAISKLWKEAPRVKTILSANTESRVSIESFLNDIDFKTIVTRQEFEDACMDIRPGFTQPIWDAMDGTGLEPADISSIILAGGISRVPMVQTAVKISFGEAKVAQNVNADEAAVLGAAFYGASLSPQFKTKEIKVEDRYLSTEDIVVSYVVDSKSGGQRTINTAIFPSGSKYGGKKILNFRRKEDFNLVLGYKHPEQPSASSVILDAELVGVTEAIANLTQRGAEDPHIRLQVGLSDSGIATIYDAFAYGEVKEESIAGKIKNFFGGSSSSTTSTETDTETASESPTSSAENAEPTEVKLKPNAIPLEINYKFLTIPPYSVEEISDARKRLIAVDQAEKVRAKTGEARNMLEGYMYRLRDYLDGDEMTPFMLFSKPEERAKLEAKYNENMAWFHEEGDTADMAALWSRRDEMEALEKPIQFRYEEHEAAPKELENLQKAIYASQVFLESAHQNRTIEETEGLPHKYTEEELEDVKQRLEENEKWLQDGIEEQKKLSKNDDPVLISAEMKARGVTLQNRVMGLLRRKDPKPPKKKEKKEKAKATESSTAEEKAQTEVPVEGEHPVHQEL